MSIDLILGSASKFGKTTYTTADGRFVYKTEDGPSKDKPKGGDSILFSRLVVGNGGVTAFQPFATIYTKWTGTCILDFAGREFEEKKFFTNKWPSLSRTFFGPDGKEYKWKVKSSDARCQLFTNDASETMIATAHDKHYGIFHDARPASLEILQGGQHMIDVILVTYVYMEIKKEQFKEVMSAVGDAGGAVAGS